MPCTCLNLFMTLMDTLVAIIEPLLITQIWNFKNATNWAPSFSLRPLANCCLCAIFPKNLVAMYHTSKDVKCFFITISHAICSLTPFVGTPPNIEWNPQQTTLPQRLPWEKWKFMKCSHVPGKLGWAHRGCLSKSFPSTDVTFLECCHI